MVKVKRLSLYPKSGEVPGEEVESSKKRGKRWVPTREKPPLKAKKLPHYRELPPKYEPAQEPALVSPPQPTPVQPVHQQPTAVQSGGGEAIAAVFLIIFMGLVFFFVILAVVDDGGGGSDVSSPSSCPSSCGSRAIMIPPSCSCPAGSKLYSRINDGGKYQGYKQCVC